MHSEKEVCCVVMECNNLMLIGYGTVDKALVMGSESVLSDLMHLGP
jgi:hypothetical protein